MRSNNSEREKSLDQVQPLLNEQARVMKAQQETGKNFSAVIADLEKRIKNSLKGKSQENK